MIKLSIAFAFWMFLASGSPQEDSHPAEDIPTNNERVIRLLDEAEDAISRYTLQNHSSRRDLLHCYVLAGDYDSALRFLLRNQRKLTYPIRDSSYWLAKRGQLSTALRLIRDYYATQGTDIYRSDLTDAYRDRLEDMISELDQTEIVTTIDRFQLRSVRTELLTRGINLAAYNERLDLAKTLALHPDADDQLEKWAGSFATLLAQNGELDHARRIAVRVMNRLPQIDNIYDRRNRAVREISRIITAVAVQQAKQGKPSAGEATFRLAHSFSPVPAAEMVRANQVDLAIEFYQTYDQETHDRNYNPKQFALSQDRQQHPLTYGAEATEDVEVRVRLLLAMEFHELQLRAIVSTLNWLRQEKLSKPEKTSLDQAALQDAQRRLESEAIACLKKIDWEKQTKSCRGLIEYLADDGQTILALSLLSAYIEPGATSFEVLLMRCSAGAIRAGNLEEGLAIVERWQPTYGGSSRNVIAAMAESDSIEYIPDVMARIQDFEHLDYERNQTGLAVARNYPWETTWQFIEQLYETDFKPHHALHVFRRVADRQGPEGALAAYRWMRQQKVAGYLNLLEGLTTNKNLEEACQIAVGLMEDQPAEMDSHEIPNRESLIQYLTEKADYGNAWRLAWYESPTSEPEWLRPLFARLIATGNDQMLNRFVTEPAPAGLARDDAALRQSFIKLAVAMVLLEFAPND